MNKIFNRKFWKYFLITFAVNGCLDKLMYYSAPINFALKYSLLTSALLLPTALCSAVSVASFMVFRRLPKMETPAFLRTLALGFAGFLVLSVAVYLSDWYVQPRLKTQAAEMLWDMKMHFPRNTKDDIFNQPDFENYSAKYMSREKLYFKLDSLNQQRNKDIAECGELLAMLPPDKVMEVYDSYGLRQMGVEYQHAETSRINEDSIAYIQETLLYDRASQLIEDSAAFTTYRIESYERNATAVFVILLYLIFATLGYCLRNDSLRKIFGIIAIVFVSVLMIYSVNHFVAARSRQQIRSIDQSFR